MSRGDIDPALIDWVAAAKEHIGRAFGAINMLPHGSDEEPAQLIEAQQHLAAARRALDAWKGPC